MADEPEVTSDQLRAAALGKTGEKPEAKAEEAKDEPKKDEPKKDDIEEIASKADNPDAVRNALQAERREAKEARERAEELAAKVKAFEDRDKSEQEKLEERASEAEKAKEAAETKLLRFEVAQAKEVPAKLVPLLTADNKKDLETQADLILENAKPGKPSGDADAGKGEGGEGQTFNDILRQRAGAV